MLTNECHVIMFTEQWNFKEWKRIMLFMTEPRVPHSKSLRIIYMDRNEWWKKYIKLPILTRPKTDWLAVNLSKHREAEFQLDLWHVVRGGGDRSVFGLSCGLYGMFDSIRTSVWARRDSRKIIIWRYLHEVTEFDQYFMRWRKNWDQDYWNGTRGVSG